MGKLTKLQKGLSLTIGIPGYRDLDQNVYDDLRAGGPWTVTLLPLSKMEGIMPNYRRVFSVVLGASILESVVVLMAKIMRLRMVAKRCTCHCDCKVGMGWELIIWQLSTQPSSDIDRFLLWGGRGWHRISWTNFPTSPRNRSFQSNYWVVEFCSFGRKSTGLATVGI